MRDNRDNKRRNRFRPNGRHFRRNGVFNNHGPTTSLGNFNRSRGNQNAAKLLEKYTNLAKEALSSGDRILSENYYQHVEHFSRILADRNLATSNKSNPTQKLDKEKSEIQENPEKIKTITDNK